jgi:hypothetical protein
MTELTEFSNKERFFPIFRKTGIRGLRILFQVDIFRLKIKELTESRLNCTKKRLPHDQNRKYDQEDGKYLHFYAFNFILQ